MRLSLCFTVCILLLTGLTARAQSRLSTFNDLIGTWCTNSEDKRFCEVWKRKDGNTLEGTSLMIVQYDTVILEHLAIQEFGNEIIYLAAPRGQSVTGFPSVRSDMNKWIFENPEHDFPQKITYFRPVKNELKAKVEGTKDGEYKALNFVWTRQDTNLIENALASNHHLKRRKKAVGVGGIFFKADNPEKLKRWYERHLGLAIDEHGSMFEFRQSDEPDKRAYLRWSPMKEDTKYFVPSDKEFMINYRVENIEKLVDDLKSSGVTVLDAIEEYVYGKFVHILDPEGNKIELWEPAEDRVYEGATTH